jgi:hypothetical protein
MITTGSGATVGDETTMEVKMRGLGAIMSIHPVLTRNAGPRQRYGAALEASSTEGTVVKLRGWRFQSRRRPILSDQDREALSQRIARFWASRGRVSPEGAGESVSGEILIPQRNP